AARAGTRVATTRVSWRSNGVNRSARFARADANGSARLTTLRLRLVGPCELELAEIRRRDAGHVFARKTRRIELLEVLVAVLHGPDEIVEILIHEPVGAEDLLDFLGRASVRDELGRCRHVDAVDVWITHRRRRRREIDFSRSGI